MSIQKELEDLIKNEVLIEIEDYIDDLFEIIAAKKEDENIKEELKQMQEMKKDFEDMLVDLVHGDIDDEECKEIMEEIKDMRKENDDEDYDEDEDDEK
jgi:RecG-like helicase